VRRHPIRQQPHAAALRLEKGLRAVLAALRQEAVPRRKGKNRRSLVGWSRENEMADMLGEVLDIVGPEGLIVSRAGNRRDRANTSKAPIGI
jgi:hypothetical protein